MLGPYGRHYVVPSWRLFDATGKSVGKLASGLSRYMQGKHKPNYEPSQMNGDYCVVINARYIHFRGENAWRDKRYFYHSRYRSGLKITPAWKRHKTDPTLILRRAVYGMMPKTKHRKYAMRYLKIFPGPYHPFQDQFTPIDMAAVQRGEQSVPRLTLADKQSIPQYIRKDRPNLDKGQRPVLEIRDGMDEMRYLRVQRLRAPTIDTQWKRQWMVRGKKSGSRYVPPKGELDTGVDGFQPKSLEN